MAVGAAGGVGFIAIGLNFILRRETHARKRQGVIGRNESAEERARMFAAGGALVSLIGVFLLIYFLAS